MFGPFLIWPLLFLLERMIGRRVRHRPTSSSSESCLFGLLVSFSRGAWFHFAVSGVVMVALAFLTAPNAALRAARFSRRRHRRPGAGCLVDRYCCCHSIAIWTMFEQRAQLIQSYDVGEGGRF